MKLATLRHNGATVAVRVDSDTAATIIDGHPDLSALLTDPDWKTVAQNASGDVVSLAGADYAPVVPHPGKIICVGLNYANTSRRWAATCPSTRPCSRSSRRR